MIWRRTIWDDEMSNFARQLKSSASSGSSRLGKEFIYIFISSFLLLVRQLAYRWQRFSCICTQYTFRVMITKIFNGDNSGFSQLFANAPLILCWAAASRCRFEISLSSYYNDTFSIIYVHTFLEYILTEKNL